MNDKSRQEYLLIPSDGQFRKELIGLSEITGRICKGTRLIYAQLEDQEDQFMRFQDLLVDLTATMEDLHKRIEVLEKQVRNIRAGQLEEELYDMLCKELKKYKEDWLFNQKKPAIKGMMDLYDDLSYLSKQEGMKGLDTLRERIIQLLSQQGVQLISDESSQLDTNFQKVGETIAVSEPEKDGQVAEVKREGFRYLDGSIIRYQKVAVYEYKEVDNNEG